MRAVSYAAAVSKAAGSSLAPLLDRQLTVEGGYPMRVDELRYCEEGGVEAAIRGETVLMGSAYFMKKRRVALPRDLKLQTGLFLAVDGVLTAVFAVKYQPSRNAEWAPQPYHAGAGRPQQQCDPRPYQAEVRRGRQGGLSRCVHPAGAGTAGVAAG